MWLVLACAVNTGLRVFVGICVFSSWCIQNIDFLDHVVVLFYNSLLLSSHWPVWEPFCIIAGLVGLLCCCFGLVLYFYIVTFTLRSENGNQLQLTQYSPMGWGQKFIILTLDVFCITLTKSLSKPVLSIIDVSVYMSKAIGIWLIERRFLKNNIISFV